MTDGHGLMDLPVRGAQLWLRLRSVSWQDRLAQFMLMVQEWRHIKLAKRAGRGHAVGGILGTGQGELCIPCHACPQPGVNLPPNWQASPDDAQ